MQFQLTPYLQWSDETAGKTGFDENRPQYLSGCREYLTHYREKIRTLHREGASGTEVVNLIREMMDVLICRLFNAIVDDVAAADASGHMALVAVGGYGRGELNPFSDIDIMVLHDDSLPVKQVEDAAQKLLYLLWDMKLDVGYSVRTIDDCVEMAAADATVKTALMDIRFLHGSQELFSALHTVVFKKILPKSADAFITEKIQDMQQRRRKFGSTVYLLEPNLKEGEGGLRDLQTAMWVARVKYRFSYMAELITKGVLSYEELESYNAALDYLWRIRNELHYFTGRKNEQLNFEAQVHLASFFGYRDSERMLAVEEFMRDYYRHANRVEYLVSTIISRCAKRDDGALKLLGYFKRRSVGDGCFIIKGELTLADESAIQQNPFMLVRVFELVQQYGVKMSIPLMGQVRRHLHLVNDKFRRNRDVNRAFMNILRASGGVAETLRLMHHLEFLSNFIPEMEHIYCKVQHDLYHIYTVDIHTLFAVEQAEKILNGELREKLQLPCQVAGQIGNPALLMLAVLLHDIGKGLGGGHSEKGAVMVPTIARRLGLSRECTERLEFLVRHHLLFAHIAQRRDLSDEKMIIQFARQLGTSENLKMLYLLSVADVRAVGSDVWTTWKAQLFDELYEKTYNVLERGDFRLEASSERVKSVVRAVQERMAVEFVPAVVQAEMKAMPVRLLLSDDMELIENSVRMLLRLDQDAIQTHLCHNLEKGYSEFTICTVDMYGLFSKITGVMAANGMNILGAQVNTCKNSKVLDILQVNSDVGDVVTDGKRWQKVEDDLIAVLQGKVQVESLVEKRQRPSNYAGRQLPRFRTQVEIDNEVSDDYTVIDVYAHDKVGLLYLITSTLSSMGLYIGVAKVSTKVDQLADVFYVKDIFGQKISSEKRLQDIKNALSQAIAQWG